MRQFPLTEIELALTFSFKRVEIEAMRVNITQFLRSFKRIKAPRDSRG
jgi:hypothetical protein